MTAYTQRQQFGLLNDPSVEINNAELQIVSSQLRRTLPESGEKMVVGHLRSLGYNITRSCVQNVLCPQS